MTNPFACPFSANGSTSTAMPTNKPTGLRRPWRMIADCLIRRPAMSATTRSWQHTPQLPARRRIADQSHHRLATRMLARQRRRYQQQDDHLVSPPPILWPSPLREDHAARLRQDDGIGQSFHRLSRSSRCLYADAVRLRIALIVLALVVLPALAFAVAENHPASHPVVGWTAYVAPTPSAGVVNTEAEKAAIQADVAKWETITQAAVAPSVIRMPLAARQRTASRLI